MKLPSGILLALACGASSKNVVEFSVTKSLPGIHVGSVPPLTRRETFSERLINNIAGGGYYVKVQVGTPPQDLTMLLDTGSSDAWVLSHEADLCTDRDLQSFYGTSCTDTYDPSKSSSRKMVKEKGFRITYLDGGTASGDYISDDFTIGGTTVRSLQMACVTQALRGTGILGLGFSISERASTKYPNIIDEMYNQGLIKSKAYSLYLNDRRTDSGSLLFGGIDTDKFIGRLGVLPLYKPPGGRNYSSFEVNFTSVSFTYANGTQHTIPTSILDHPAPAVLDSGTTLSYLPDKLAGPIDTALGTFYDVSLQMTLIDCVHPLLETDPAFHLTFTFTPTTSITIPLADLILDILPPSYPQPGSESDDNSSKRSSQGSTTTTTQKNKACVFGIQSTDRFAASFEQKEANFTLLGDTFLRSAYVVYDLSHYQIGLAQANLNSSSIPYSPGSSGDSNSNTIIELIADDGRSESGTGTQGEGGAGSGGLPSGLMGVSAQQTTFTPTATATAPSDHGGQNAAAGLTTNSKSLIGEVIGVAVVTVLFTLLGGALIAV
ncbi:aspartic peptidase domain-containing protein [Corynascus similis CBS 632.67]